MKCPKCGKENNYVASHSRKYEPIKNEYRRQRICRECGNKFNTIEQIKEK